MAYSFYCSAILIYLLPPLLSFFFSNKLKYSCIAISLKLKNHGVPLKLLLNSKCDNIYIKRLKILLYCDTDSANRIVQ